MRIARFAQNGDTFSTQSLVARISTVIDIIVVSTVHHLISSTSLNHARNSAACLLDQSLKKQNKETNIKIINFVHRSVYAFDNLSIFQFLEIVVKLVNLRPQFRQNRIEEAA